MSRVAKTLPAAVEARSCTRAVAVRSGSDSGGAMPGTAGDLRPGEEAAR
jgi:hypothetical protein